MIRSVLRQRPVAALGTALAAAVALALTAPTADAAPAATGDAAGAAAHAVPYRVVTPRAGEPAWQTAARQSATVYVRNGRQVTVGPNPELALVPNPAQLDRAGWAKRTAALAAQRAAVRQATRAAATATPRLAVKEGEPNGVRGRNDTLVGAQPIAGFGTAAGRTHAADISGNQSAGPAPKLTKLAPNVEDDGLPRLGRPTGVSKKRPGFRTTGFLGDAPDVDGEPQDDNDFYRMDLVKGQLFSASLDFSQGEGEVVIFAFGEDGSFLGDSYGSPDWTQPSIDAPVPSTGRYSLVVIPVRVINLDTGESTLANGDYDIKISVRDGDTDTYRVALKAGDVLGVNGADAATLVGIYGADGATLMTSGQDATSIMPAVTPLPGGGNAVAELVAPTAGTYYVNVLGGEGRYTLNLEVYRPGSTGQVTQTVFLDFDGQRQNTGIWGGRGVTTLSPLSAFLADWGLPAVARGPLARRITETVQENLESDLRAAGLSSTVSVNVVSSDDSPDLWGQEGVMRVIVGGTIEESGIPTIGIAQSIDPGNFEREETALVLLDVLSASPDERGPATLNAYLTPRSQKIRFVGRAIGNVVAHEVGHTIGNWHTDNSNTVASLMDAGGEFSLLFGAGPDGVGGTADDIDTDFVTDTFSLQEGFGGQENTTSRSAWALSR